MTQQTLNQKKIEYLERHGYNISLYPITTITNIASQSPTVEVSPIPYDYAFINNMLKQVATK